MNQDRWSARTERSTDISPVREINLAAFPTPEEADLVDALRADIAWIPELSIVVTTAHDLPIGFALLTRCYIGQSPALCLAPCAVLPEYQRAGAGSVAIKYALQSGRTMGEDYVVVLGHPDYYPRFGFTRATQFGIHLSIQVLDDALMVLSLQDEPIPAGQVTYAAPFGI